MMAQIYLSLSLVVFAKSLSSLLKESKRGPISFVFLLCLHGLVGCGFLLLAAYRLWEWGELHPAWSWVSFTDTVYLYTLLICLTLLGFSHVRRRALVYSKPRTPFRLRSFSFLECSVLMFLLLVYAAGLRFGTLRVGLEIPVVLPFRLNGLIEVVILFVLPFYLSLRSLSLRNGYWIGLCLIIICATINITSFGAKSTVIRPLIVFLCTVVVFDRVTWIRILAPAAVIVALYTLLNPYYFREEIGSGSQASSLDLLKQSRESVYQRGWMTSAHGLRNFGHRITGIVPMQLAIDHSDSVVDALALRDIVWDMERYYNERITHTRIGSSNATGHYAYFMFMFRNHVLGFCIAEFLVAAYFYVCLRMDTIAEKRASSRSILVGVTFVQLCFPFLLDANYDNLSHYLHLVFCMFLVSRLFPLLFRTGRKSTPGSRVIGEAKRPFPAKWKPLPPVPANNGVAS